MVLASGERRDPSGGAARDIGRVQVLLEPPSGRPGEGAAVGRPGQVVRVERHIRDDVRRPAHRHHPQPSEREHPHARGVGRESEPHESTHVLRRGGRREVDRRKPAPRTPEGKLGGERDLLRRALGSRDLPQATVCSIDQPATVRGPARPCGRHVGLPGEPDRRRARRIHRNRPHLPPVRRIPREESDPPPVRRERRCERRDGLGGERRRPPGGALHEPEAASPFAACRVGDHGEMAPIGRPRRIAEIGTYGGADRELVRVAARGVDPGDSAAPTPRGAVGRQQPRKGDHPAVGRPRRLRVEAVRIAELRELPGSGRTSLEQPQPGATAAFGPEDDAPPVRRPRGVEVLRGIAYGVGQRPCGTAAGRKLPELAQQVDDEGTSVGGEVQAEGGALVDPDADRLGGLRPSACGCEAGEEDRHDRTAQRGHGRVRSMFGKLEVTA